MLLNAETQYQIEQFFYAEAALLDAHRHEEWLDLFTDDCRYWMPVRQATLAKQSENEFSKPDEIAFFNEDKTSLGYRVKKIESPYAWGESPRPRTRHMCSNIRVLSVDGDEMTTECAFVFYRTQVEADVDWFVGRREDVLRRVGDSFKIVKRSLFLDQTIIYAKNMNQFF